MILICDYVTLLVHKHLAEQFQLLVLHVLDFCLLHYFLSSDGTFSLKKKKNF